MEAHRQQLSTNINTPVTALPCVCSADLLPCGALHPNRRIACHLSTYLSPVNLDILTHILPGQLLLQHCLYRHRVKGRVRLNDTVRN